ncbi:MAG: cobalamin-dependent protein [Deltaproteobacteria bacterium]|nr:cobalamin-dependent protein [Deltaproteobacteria bacterium]MBW1816959.1 cobalamin-dependent protein [Deltaproteobacteria bacterium]MBW2285963.1 cobalamin-dependent protein [Deltaproteobacteria bacterium]
MERIRILIGMLGLDQHEVGAIAVSRMLRDAGMEVIYTGRFNTPAGTVKTGMEEDVDVIGLSCHSWEYLHYMPELLQILKDRDLNIPIVVGGSVITPGDAKQLKAMGVAASFGPSAINDEIIETIRKIASQR